MATHPNRSRKTISVKLSEEELDWLIFADRVTAEDRDEGTEESFPAATDEFSRRLEKARDDLRGR